VTLLEPFRAPGTARVHQVGIVVEDIERAIAGHARLLGFTEESWRRADFGPESVEQLFVRGEPAEFSVRLGFAGSDPELELIEPMSGPSIYRERLDGHGEGLHHLAVVVTSLGAATEAMEAAGFGVLQAGMGFAPEGRGGFAYYETAHALGYVLEAVELP
jgi:catechol 2,3-dioxygenase-like lactoylglutathione lyase family enzyme